MAEGLMLLSGTAHPALAMEVAAELDVDLVKTDIGRFPDGEAKVKIYENVRGRTVFVLQAGGRSPEHSIDENLMEALVTIDALKRAAAGRIVAVLPYFPYARQDRTDDSSEWRSPVTAKLVTDLFKAAGADQLLTVDLHSDQIEGYADGPFDHLRARGVLARFLKGKVVAPVVATPDLGAGKMAGKFAKCLGTDDIAFVHKDRLDERTTRVAAVIGDVAGRDVVLVDDVVSTGGSLVGAAEALKAHGAESVIAAITHGVLSGDALKLITDSPHLDHLYITNTLPLMEPSPKITVVSIAPLLASAIDSVHTGESVRGLISVGQ